MWKNRMGCWTLAALVSLGWPQLLAAQERDCVGWGTPEFFGALHTLLVPGSLIRNDDVAGAATATDVRGCLAKGADVKVRNRFGHTVLHYASVGANPAVIRALLDAGADVNARDETGYTALHAASGRGANVAVIAALLEAGSDVMARTGMGSTALHRAAASADSGDPAIVTTLLEAGADVMARDDEGNTPLHFAAKFSDDPAIVSALLEAGADVAARDEDGTTPWGEALARAEEDPEFKISDIYWLLNDARFRGNQTDSSRLH